MKVSACVPVYNTASHYLVDLIESVRSQSYDNYEIIVCDDCSTVNYDAVARRYESEPRFRYFRNPSNLGMAPNWNNAVQHSQGEVVIVLGQDDQIKPGLFAACVEAFSCAPDVVLVSCSTEFIGAEGQKINPKVNVNHRSNIFLRDRKYLLSGREVAYLCLRNGGALGELSAQAFRRKAFDAVGGFSVTHSAMVQMST